MSFQTPSRVMAGIVTLILLGLYGFVLIVPAFNPAAVFDANMTQTLLTLTVVAVTYYLGTNNSSAGKDQTIAKQAEAAATIASTVVAAPLGAGPTGTPADPVSVEVAPGDASAKALGTLASMRNQT